MHWTGAGHELLTGIGNGSVLGDFHEISTSEAGDRHSIEQNKLE